MLTVPLLINGKDVLTEKTFDVVSPTTGKVIHNSAAASLKEVELAVDVRLSPKVQRPPPPQPTAEIPHPTSSVQY
jgi:acyl-CoA reductase-like NAD-dependent aldehyde dehydrogenase